jgi:hypothetical protein
MKGVVYEGTMDEQGGGHGRISKCKVQPSGAAGISKPLDHKEGEAYRQLQDTPLKAVTPIFYGIHKEGDSEMIIISDVTDGFTSPCLADFKVGRRHYDPDAKPEKVAGLIEKQKGSTTDSLAVRLIDGKVRKAGQVTSQWDRKQGLKFSPTELESVVHEFVPSCLRAQFHAGLDAVYQAFSETVEAHPGFRMYASSVLAAYDGDNPTEIRVLLIDFAHTHLSLKDEGFDENNVEYDDGVLEGVVALMNWSESEGEARGAPSLDLEILEDTERHKRIRRATLKPGGQRVILRAHHDGEHAAYALWQGKGITNFMPAFYGTKDGLIVVEDIGGEFKSACILDIRLSDYTREPGAPADAKAQQGSRILGGETKKGGESLKKWSRTGSAGLDKAGQAGVVAEFLPSAVAAKVTQDINALIGAVEDLRKEQPGFRLYAPSLLIAYDGDDLKKAPRVALNNFAHVHTDIAKEGFDVGDAKYDDNLVQSLTNVLTLMPSASSSSCCLLL